MQEIMDVTDIAFPNLGIYLQNVPKSFSVFGFEITFYGIIIGIGVLLGLLLAVKVAKMTGQNPEIYWDLSIYAIIFSVIGARIYYVAFSWDNYKDDLLSIFNTRGGGMAIYGAVIAAFITLAIYSKVKKQSFFQLGDTGVAGLLIGQIVGRWANFMNRECFGGYTDKLLAMRLPIDAVRSNDISADIAAHIVDGTNYIQVHPAYLYESLWNVGVLIILLLYTKHKKFHGEICLLYIGGYGLGRFWVESLRTDQLLIPGTDIAVSMALGLLMFIFAVITEVIIRVRLKKIGKEQSEQQE